MHCAYNTHGTVPYRTGWGRRFQSRRRTTRRREEETQEKDANRFLPDAGLPTGIHVRPKTLPVVIWAFRACIPVALDGDPGKDLVSKSQEQVEEAVGSRDGGSELGASKPPTNSTRAVNSLPRTAKAQRTGWRGSRCAVSVLPSRVVCCPAVHADVSPIPTTTVEIISGVELGGQKLHEGADPAWKSRWIPRRRDELSRIAQNATRILI